MSKFKKTGIFFLVLLCVCCLAIDVWYIVVNLHAPTRIPSKIFEGGLLTTTSGDVEYLWEVELYKNANNDGYEMYEIKSTYMLDETNESFYSQGLQFIASSQEEKLNWQYCVDDSRDRDNYYKSEESAFWGNFWYKTWGSYSPTNGEVYNYASSNNYETTINSTNPFSDATRLKIQLDGKNYLMKFRNLDTISAVYEKDLDGKLTDNAQAIDKDTYVGEAKVEDYMNFLYHVVNYEEYHHYYDVYFFSMLMYESIQTIKAGTSQAVVFEFGDYFDYFEYDEATQTYSDVRVQDSTKIVQDMKSYYAIKVTVHENGAKRASDSMFNCMFGSPNFNSTNEYTSDDYFTGYTVIQANIYNFDFVKVLDNNYALKLKDSFIQNYKQYKNIRLLIEIDLDALKSKDINFAGFTSDSGLDNFEVIRCYTTETINGEIIKTEVEL